MADLILEIGAEEIPAGFVPGALEQLKHDLAKALAEARLAHGDVVALGTPRRLFVCARDVAAKAVDAKTEALGPPVAQAFDAEGRPTQAALGFAKSQGVEVAALERVQTPKGERLAVTKVEKGRKADALLPGILGRLVAGLRFRKAMRSRWDEVTPQTLVMKDGEHGDSFCFLLEGELRVVKKGRVLNVLSPGEVFGEMAVVGGGHHVRGADVVAQTTARVVTIAGQALRHASEATRMHFYQSFLQVMASRLSIANARLASN